MARPSWRPARSRTRWAKRSGAPELAPFLQRSGREEPACRRGKREACEGFGWETAAIGRCAIDRESFPSIEGARPYRRAPVTVQNRALAHASTYASPRVSRDPAQIISLGQRLGFASDGRCWRRLSSRIQAPSVDSVDGARAHDPPTNSASEARLIRGSAPRTGFKVRRESAAARLPFEGEDAFVASKAAQETQDGPASGEAGPMIRVDQSPLRRDQIRVKSSSPSTFTREA